MMLIPFDAHHGDDTNLFATNGFITGIALEAIHIVMLLWELEVQTLFAR